MAGTAASEFSEFSRRLAKVGKAPAAPDAVAMLADIYVDRARQVMGHDTNQLHNRTRVVSVTGTPSKAVAVVEADTPYAGYHNYGNPWTGPNLFWDEGLRAAEQAVDAVGMSMYSSIERMLTSGGVWNPRRVS